MLVPLPSGLHTLFELCVDGAIGAKTWRS